MTTNTMVVRTMACVVLAVTLLTAAGLAYGRHHDAPAAADDPPDRASGPPTAAQGAIVFARVGCNVCHTIDGTPRVGPSLAHRWGTPVALVDGSSITFDEHYVRESILAPRAKSQPGYPPAMPEYEGIVREREITALSLYVRSL